MFVHQLPPKFAEGMNGALFLDLTFALLMFGTYIIYELRRGGYRMRAKAAISVEVMLLGELILRGWFWLWRIQINTGQNVGWMDDLPVVPIGMSIEMLGVLCLIRVFSPDTWSRQTWLAVGVMSVLFACAAAFGW
jgi:hypothetical protein